MWISQTGDIYRSCDAHENPFLLQFMLSKYSAFFSVFWRWTALFLDKGKLFQFLRNFLWRVAWKITEEKKLRQFTWIFLFVNVKKFSKHWSFSLQSLIIYAWLFMKSGISTSAKRYIRICQASFYSCYLL